MIYDRYDIFTNPIPFYIHVFILHEDYLNYFYTIESKLDKQLRDQFLNHSINEEGFSTKEFLDILKSVDFNKKA